MSDSEEEQEQREANVTRNNRMQRARLLDEYGSFMRASGNANIKKILMWLESGLKLEEDRLERVEKILVEGTAKESERERARRAPPVGYMEISSDDEESQDTDHGPIPWRMPRRLFATPKRFQSIFDQNRRPQPNVAPGNQQPIQHQQHQMVQHQQLSPAAYAMAPGPFLNNQQLPVYQQQPVNLEQAMHQQQQIMKHAQLSTALAIVAQWTGHLPYQLPLAGPPISQTWAHSPPMGMVAPQNVLHPVSMNVPPPALVNHQHGLNPVTTNQVSNFFNERIDPRTANDPAHPGPSNYRQERRPPDPRDVPGPRRQSRPEPFPSGVTTNDPRRKPAASTYREHRMERNGNNFAQQDRTDPPRNSRWNAVAPNKRANNFAGRNVPPNKKLKAINGFHQRPRTEAAAVDKPTKDNAQASKAPPRDPRTSQRVPREARRESPAVPVTSVNEAPAAVSHQPAVPLAVTTTVSDPPRSSPTPPRLETTATTAPLQSEAIPAAVPPQPEVTTALPPPQFEPTEVLIPPDEIKKEKDCEPTPSGSQPFNTSIDIKVELKRESDVETDSNQDSDGDTGDEASEMSNIDELATDLDAMANDPDFHAAVKQEKEAEVVNPEDENREDHAEQVERRFRCRQISELLSAGGTSNSTGPVASPWEPVIHHDDDSRTQSPQYEAPSSPLDAEANWMYLSNGDDVEDEPLISFLPQTPFQSEEFKNN